MQNSDNQDTHLGDSDNNNPSDDNGGERSEEEGVADDGFEDTSDPIPDGAQRTRGPGGDRGVGRREGAAAVRSVVGRVPHGDGEGRGSRTPSGSERRRSFQNADELLLDEVKARAQRASARLKECILGTFMVELTNGKRFGFDCRQAEMVVVPLPADLGAHAPPDCSIRLSEDNLLRIASGDLNPQVGMLSDKIRVKGKSSIAVYFFNLIAPRAA